MNRRFTISLHRVGDRFSRPAPMSNPVCDHLDWFFQTDPHPDSPLATLSTSPSGLDASPLHATRLADHRSRYLDFSGEISAGRGNVKPLVTGFYRQMSQDSGHLVVHILSAAVVPEDNEATGEETARRSRIALMKRFQQPTGSVIRLAG